MRLIVGLGNPGNKYKNNRHNVGHLFIDYLVNQLTNSQINKFKLYKTDCYMNESGKFVKKIIGNWKLEIGNLIVIHDDLDIPLGKFKIQKATGPLLHNGLESIEKALGAKDFWRVRIGIDNRLPQGKNYLVDDRIIDNKKTAWIDGESYVLQDFLPEEKKIIDQLFPKIYLRLKVFLATRRL